jgi:hypothetical protein
MGGGTINDFTNGLQIGTKSLRQGLTTNRAASTVLVDDFTNGHKGALLMASLMDATAEGEQNNLKQNNNMYHQMGLKLALVISKQEILPCYHANLKLSMH